ncbi:hypothetical protein BDP27DRAFT_1372939 [Rhodocollybia butyracea]|uniref:Uncharacterized protein n=1 Tax=Rhodocollybia butyracea TaxID=206335 RepID=A0A9P5TXG7_9AGAR|nr:hypothetical protein BDP27DRAFT_1372939 [Rhodocollybia butyracea]
MPPRKSKKAENKYERVQQLEKKRDEQLEKIKDKKATGNTKGLTILVRHLKKIEIILKAAKAEVNTVPEKDEGEDDANVQPTHPSQDDVGVIPTEMTIDVEPSQAKPLAINVGHVLRVDDCIAINGIETANRHDDVRAIPNGVPMDIDPDVQPSRTHTGIDIAGEGAETPKGMDVDPDVQPSRAHTGNDIAVDGAAKPLAIDVTHVSRDSVSKNGAETPNQAEKGTEVADGYSTSVESTENAPEDNVRKEDNINNNGKHPSHDVEEVEASPPTTAEFTSTIDGLRKNEIDLGLGRIKPDDNGLVARGMMSAWRNKVLQGTPVPWNGTDMKSIAENLDFYGSGHGGMTASTMYGAGGLGDLGGVTMVNTYEMGGLGVGGLDNAPMVQVTYGMLTLVVVVIMVIVKDEESEHGSTFMLPTAQAQAYHYAQSTNFNETRIDNEVAIAPKATNDSDAVETTETARNKGAERMKDLENARNPKTIAEARLALDKWKKNPKHEIRAGLRRLMRTINEFVPKCASICYQLAMHILSTDARNVRCIQHSHTRITKQNDRDGSTRSWKVTGTPFPAFEAGDNPKEVLNSAASVALFKYPQYLLWRL